MLVTGVSLPFAGIGPGDTVTLDDQLLFVCARRPELLDVRDVEVPYSR